MNDKSFKIFDCFTFYNEIKMLQLRIAELKDKVDCFVLVEAGETFSGIKKENIFQNNKNLFSGNIHSISVEGLKGSSAWDREAYQRELFKVALRDAGAKDDDIIIISDVDEIIDPEAISKIYEITKPVNIQQDMYYYDFRCKQNVIWNKAKAIKYSDFIKYKSVESIRMSKYRQTIYPGGWHLSYFGDADWIIKKIKSFSHQEYNNPYFLNKEKIDKAIESGTDLFDRKISYQHIPIEDNTYLPRNYKMLL